MILYEFSSSKAVKGGDVRNSNRDPDHDRIRDRSPVFRSGRSSLLAPAPGPTSSPAQPPTSSPAQAPISSPAQAPTSSPAPALSSSPAQAPTSSPGSALSSRLAPAPAPLSSSSPSRPATALINSPAPASSLTSSQAPAQTPALSNLPVSWNVGQYEHFRIKYPFIYIANRALGCEVCRDAGSPGVLRSGSNKH